jgi:hypothetical protein
MIKIDRWIVPIPSAANIAPGCSTLVTARPTRLFRAREIYIDPISAPHFHITMVVVGTKTQMDVGEVPASLFMQLSDDVRELAAKDALKVMFRTCERGMGITFTVKNKMTESRDFGGGALVGEALT